MYDHYRAVFTWLSKGIGFGFGFGFTTPFGSLVYLLWFWFYDSQVKTALWSCCCGLLYPSFTCSSVLRAWHCDLWGRQCDQLLHSGNQIFTPGRLPGPQDRWLSSLGKRTLINDNPLSFRKLNPLILKYNFWRPEYLFWRQKMKTWGPAGPTIFFWKSSTGTGTK